MACIILRNMIIKNERDEYLPNVEVNQNLGILPREQ
jgi:hypothetical protein